MQNDKFLLSFCHLPTMFLEKCIWMKKASDQHTDRKQSKDPQFITVMLEEACLYWGHITFSETTATFGRQLRNLLVCFRIDKKRSTCSRGSQALTPSTRTSLAVVDQSFTSRIKNYCVAQLFTYCWSCDCFRTTLKYFWLEWALISEGSFTHTPLVHKCRERNSSDKNLLTARVPLTRPATDCTHTAHTHEQEPFVPHFWGTKKTFFLHGYWLMTLMNHSSYKQ